MNSDYDYSDGKPGTSKKPRRTGLCNLVGSCIQSGTVSTSEKSNSSDETTDLEDRIGISLQNGSDGDNAAWRKKNSIQTKD